MAFQRYLCQLRGFDIYLVKAKCQHGVCKINQLPWKFDGKMDELLSNLEDIKEQHEENLKLGLLPSGFLIVTELT